MIRRIFLPFTLALLASCAQNPLVDPVLDTPTTISTELADGATQVATGTDGSVYVLGYRNGAESVDPPGYTSEFYVSHFDTAGRLVWLTLIPGKGLQGDNLRGLVVAKNAVYALLQSDAGASAHVHKLQLDGTLLWSRAISRTTEFAYNLIAAPNGQLYLSRLATDGRQFVTALDAAGTTLWEREVDDGSPQATGADSSVYINGYDTLAKVYTFSRYSADGVLLWSRKLEATRF